MSCTLRTEALARAEALDGYYVLETTRTVAEADGSPVPQAAQDSALALAQAIEPGSFSSLHDDLVAGRRMELEALHGFVVRRAAQHALAVPMSDAVYAMLQPWAVHNQRASA